MTEMLKIVLVPVFVLLLLIIIVLNRSMSRSSRILIGILPVVYLALFTGSLWSSYSTEMAKIHGFAERDAVAARHLWSVLDAGGEPLSTVSLVRAANLLHVHLAQAAEAYGPSTWNIHWQYGIIPEFDAGNQAETLFKLVDVPPTIVYAQNRYMIQRSQYEQFARSYGEQYIYYYRILEAFLYGITTDVENKLESCGSIISGINFAQENPADPLSRSSRLVRTSTSMIASLAKMDEVFHLAHSELDSTKTMVIHRVHRSESIESDNWAPLSPLFLNISLIREAYTSPGLLETRWIGEPPRPVVGSTLSTSWIAGSLHGDIPNGQGTWTDSTLTGQVYRVTSNVAEVFQDGNRIVRTAGRPQVMTYGTSERSFTQNRIELFPHTTQPD